MRLMILLISFSLLTTFVSCQNGQQSTLMLLSSHIPADTALVFARGIISTNHYEFAITFSPEMDEILWTRRKPDADNEIYTMKLVDGCWTHPQQVAFKARIGWDFEPHIEPSGTRLYFGSTRPLIDNAQASGLHQWYCSKDADGWSAPSALEKPFAEWPVIMYLTSTKKGHLYFTAGRNDERPEEWAIFHANKVGDTYGNIERMGSEINFEGRYIAHPYISPDESYLIFDGEGASGYGDNDLYISFNKNGRWTKALNMGPKVNTDQTEMCPSVSPDETYLFFHRGGDDYGDIYWITLGPIKERLVSQTYNESKTVKK